jgi:hypothetical protein
MDHSLYYTALYYDPLFHILCLIPYCIYYFVGDILANLSDDMFFVIVYLRPKTSSDKIRKKTLYNTLNLIQTFPSDSMNRDSSQISDHQIQ